MALKKYVIAVSGGVDSVALLHKLATVRPNNVQYIVAHVDHGIRKDSSYDAEFVRELARTYKFDFELTKLNLGSSASEDTARNERYKFLFSISKKYKADAVITAHHQDDVLETMIVNMLRGTGPSGLVGYSRSGILRPLINKTKKEIVNYAEENNLDWREDSTNSDEKYLRNYVRANYIPKLAKKRDVLLEVRRKLIPIVDEIDYLSKRLLVQIMKRDELIRADFVVLPYSVQLELITNLLRLKNIIFDKKTIEKAVLSIKTLSPGKQVELSKQITLFSNKKTIVFKVRVPNV